MVEGDERLDVGGEQLVDEAIVEVEPGLVRPPPSVGEDARPGDREAERVQPQLRDEPHVLVVAVVGVTRDRSTVAVDDLAGCRGEAIPDALASPVRVDGTLDLVRGHRGSPDEVRGEAGRDAMRCRLCH